jgi:manganese transport protein
MLNFEEPSLPEVHSSVNTQGKNSWWRFIGPGFLVSVGYMDPGNWATDLQGGSKFGYQLLWVILISNLMAILLQSICVRIGIGGGFDLAQGCRRAFNKPLAVLLWILAEIAMIATDVAEVIGSAIALQLIFGLNMIVGVLITGLDVLLILGLMKFGFRKLEAFIIALVMTIGVCFFVNLYAVKPDLLQAGKSLIPTSMPSGDALAIAIGIIGATVMPHNLYLHSAIVQTRATDDKKFAIKNATIDTVIALGGAFFVNAAILVLAAAVFHSKGQVVESINQAHELLKPIMGGAAATLFAVALLASGQSSTITGTLSGQVVMEGFMQWKIAPWLRRLITRGLALIPAVLIVLFAEGKDIDGLVISQIMLSLQLPFAIFPLVVLGANKALLKEHVISPLVKWTGLAIGVIICGLNVMFLGEKFGWVIVATVGFAVMAFCGWAQYLWKPRSA